MNPGDELRALHSRELPDLPGAERHLSTDQFHGTGLGAVFNRTGTDGGGTSSSVNSRHVAGAGRNSAKLVQAGEV